jgi:type II secretory pathway pseudopilin PulG
VIPRLKKSRRSRGYSLAEMLIVVTILIMLVAVSLPVAKKMMDGSSVREASRQLHAYIAMAKARALQTGRPCGVYLAFPEPPLGLQDPALSNAAQYQAYWPVRQVTQLFLAETPPPFSGSVTTAVGKIDTSGNVPVLRVWNMMSPNPAQDTSEMLFLGSLLDPGEQFLVRFNYKGDWYICTYDSANNAFVFNPLIQRTSVLPHGFNNNAAPGVPFQVLRSPRPVGNALELPRGSCIDITYSGVGSQQRQFRIPQGVNSHLTGLTILFSPGGGIDSMYLNSRNANRIPMDVPAASLFFLMGKVEKAGNPTDTTNISITLPQVYTDIENSNLADPNSLWVVVNRGTGQVTTAENMPPPIDRNVLPTLRIFPGEQPPPAGRFIANGTIQQYVAYCREAAITGEQAGGQ